MSLLRALLILTLFSPVASMAANVDQRVAFELFKRDVHPFLRKNCAECHGEGAEGWEGPPHSYSDTAIAFAAFIKRINFDDPEKSRMFMQARNQHFCKEFGSCKEADRRSSEAMAKFMKYIADVKASSAIGNDGRAQSTDISATIPGLRKYDKLVPWTSAPQKAPDSYVTNGDNTGAAFLTFNVNKNLDVELIVQRVRANLYVISNIFITGRKGIYAVQDMSILVNGKPAGNLMGIEKMDRALYFSTPASSARQQVRMSLTSSKPVIMAQPGDEITVGFANLQQLEKYPSLVCDRKKDAFPEFKNSLELRSDSILWELKAYGGTDLEICYRIESLLDGRVPRRSPLLNGVEAGEASRLIEKITKWME